MEYLDISMRVRVEDDAEKEKILEALYSGSASEIMRVGILYGLFGGQPITPKVAEPLPELKRVEVGEVTSASPIPNVKKEKRKSLLGGKRRMNRV